MPGSTYGSMPATINFYLMTQSKFICWSETTSVTRIHYYDILVAFTKRKNMNTYAVDYDSLWEAVQVLHVIHVWP